MAVDDAAQAEALVVGERSCWREDTDQLPGALGDGPGDGMLRRVLERAHQSQGVLGRDAVDCDDVDEGHLAGRDCSGLVEHHGVDPASGLEDLGTLDEDPRTRRV